MNREIALKLADALESGEYAQGRSRLCLVNENGSKEFCCLGVLSEIAVQEGVIRRFEGVDDVAYGSSREDEDGELGYCFPPDSIGVWAELDTPPLNTIYFDVTGHPKLVWGEEDGPPKREGDYTYDGRIIVGAHELNDHFNFTFAEIAQLIRNDKIVPKPEGM